MPTYKTCLCQNCNREFAVLIKNYNKSVRQTGHEPYYCSLACNGAAQKRAISTKCDYCGIFFEKKASKIKATRHHFCSQSHAAKYHNQHRQRTPKGTRNSKIERFLQEELTHLYPSLDFHFNQRDAINSELDIYIPSLKLAFELNGIFHYEPIYGPEKLAQITNNDERKFQACLERGIELCVIDISGQKHFTVQSSKNFLAIIVDLLAAKKAFPNDTAWR